MRPIEWIWAGALLLVFAPAIRAMSAVWSGVDYYSHGYLVPLVALWAAYGMQPQMAKLSRAREPRALLALVGALSIYAIGLGADDVSIQGVAFVCATGAMVAFQRGWPWLRVLAFPISYLFFMVPLPQAWLTPIIVRLQLFVSEAAVALLPHFGTNVLRDGNVLELPSGGSLFVAEACSGITSIVTLLPLAVFLAYFTERTWLRRAVLVAAVLPLAMAGNLLRVVGTVMAANAWGVEAATEGPLHEWAGMATYVLGCFALLGVGALINWFVPRQKVQTAQ